ncbi:MAG: DUF1700 domain-containing protein [Clostridiales bacterium]|nr:DUF1700 domain-containing protein [Clostridiales bacterium]
MNREEFLEGLQSALSGRVPPSVVRENLRYYDEYIRGEAAKGRPEADVLAELGDPRLIARTIEDTTPGAGEGNFDEYRANPFGDMADRYREATEEDSARTRGSVHYYDLNKWYWKLIAIVVIVLVVALMLAVVSGILTLVIPLLPVIIAVLMVMWIVRMF